ncbi:MAG: integrase, partial [Proteobacteria bacterium]|nr:integrase [Pseudomonadota bacterium]
DYVAALGPIQDEKHPLFMTFDRNIIEGKVHWTPSRRPMSQMLSYAMLQRRAKKAGLVTSICNHTFRATGITTFLRCGGSLERAAVIANHESLRTTQLYDRRSREVTVEEIENIRI